MSVLLGIDHGGTRTKLLLAQEQDAAFTVIRRATVSTHGDAGSLEELAAAVAAFIGEDRPDAFGITVAGILDDDSGIVRASVNMPWLTGIRPAQVLGEALGVPGVALHDGGAAAHAEAVDGAGRDHRDVFVLALGTGIAGAHVVDGVVRRGAHGAAGEVGHVPLGGTRPCSCGQRGCLESEIGGSNLAARWKQESSSDDEVTAVDLMHAADAGDERAIAILRGATDALAQSLLGVVAVVDPGIIVIGGGLSGSPKWIVDPAIKAAKEQATFHRIPPVRAAELGVWAGAWGAVHAADRHAMVARALEGVDG